MKNKTFFSIILILFAILASEEGYTQSRNIIGKKTAKSIVRKKKDPLSVLAHSITVNSYSDSEKAYSIYRWIATHIAYDNYLMLNEGLQKKIYISEENVVQEVLKRRKALCGGYAFLFRDLCRKVGVRAEVIHGFTKNPIGKVINSKTPNHTWNAVWVDGKWKLLDITWAVGYGKKENPDDFWFDTPANDFIYTHYPEDPRWTLLSGKNLSFAEFQH